MVFKCKVATIWPIKKETFIKDINSFLNSDLIHTNIDGYKYKFGIQESGGDVAIYITGEDDDMGKNEVKELTVSIPSADYKGDLSTVAEVPKGHRFHGYTHTAILKYEDMLNPDKKYFVDDILTLKFHGIIEYNKKLEPKSLSELLWDSKDDMDFTFIVGTNKIKAHKFVLRRYSSVFAKLIDSKVNNIEIKDFDYGCVYDILRLCYSVTCYAGIYGLLDCLRYADFYEMPIIKERIGHGLSDEIDPQNVCELANKSVELKCPTLKGYCINYISNCLKDFTPYDGALDLNAEIVQEIYKSSVCDTLNS